MNFWFLNFWSQQHLIIFFTDPKTFLNK
jgi:hypothetical protein